MDDTYLHTIPETISASESITVSSDSTIDSSEEDYSGYSSLDDELELSDEKSSTSCMSWANVFHVASYSSMDIDLNRIPIKSQRDTNYQTPSSTTVIFRFCKIYHSLKNNSNNILQNLIETIMNSLSLAM